jgi:flagellar hook-associated protein 2
MAVNTGSGYRLQVMAAETGAASSVGLDTGQFTAFSGFTTLVSGRDAQIEIQGDNPYTITSASNTFDDVMPGVDITVTQTTAGPVTVTVGEDNEAQADAIAEVVEAINKFLERADAATAANPGAEPGMLFGNSAVRRTRDAILQAVTAGVASSTFEAASLAGITVTREGRLEFDRSKFIEASETDRGERERQFVAPSGDTDLGILDRIVAAAEEATATGSGRLWSEAEATKSRIERWGDQIDAYETRFELREATLRRQYAALEVALGALNEQSNYLAGQLAGLTTNPGG